MPALPPGITDEVDPSLMPLTDEPEIGAMPVSGLGVDGAAEESAEPEYAETPDDEKALVTQWWERTEQRADFVKAVAQYEKDLETIAGGTEAELADESLVTTQDVYRNAMQTVAMTVPGIAAIELQAEDVIDAMPGDLPMGHPIRKEIDRLKRYRTGQAKVLTTLVHRFAKTGKLQEKLEALVQDATHFPIAIAKTWFQRDFSEDPASDARISDEQDQVENVRVLLESYDRGEFDDRSAAHAELVAAMEALGRTELDVRRTVILELVNLKHYRCDPAITSPENKDRAGWERQDVLMRGSDILAKYPKVKPDDVSRCPLWSLDSVGSFILQKKEDQTSLAGSGMATTNAGRQLNRDTPMLHNAGSGNVDDWHLVAEIYDYRTNRRITLVNGLDYQAQNVALVDEGEGLSPFHVVVLNRKPESLVGYSDTQLQAKLQRLKQRMRSQEEEAKNNAQPRWAYDPAVITDPESIKKITNSEPLDLIPVAISGKGTLSDSLLPLASNHNYNREEHSTDKVDNELRRASMLPDQALGVTGNADFAAEVNTATAGAMSMAKFRGRIITRAIGSIVMSWAKLLLWNLPIEEVVRICGPAAALYWPQTPEERKELFQNLTANVETSLDQDLDAARKTQSLAVLTESLAKVPAWINKQAYARILAKYLGIPDQAKELVEPDAAGLIEQLMMALQSNPEALPPEGMMLLAQMGAQAAEQLQQIQAEEQMQNGEQPGGPMAGGPGGI